MADESDGLTVTIGAREIYDELVGVRADVRSLLESRADVDKTLGDHESRIRVLERWKYGIPGVVALSAIAAGIQIFHG
ncbi:hypothetical protein [Streptomyces noursei]|uniref:hypothetical protein n=1 Tax=Streptomyces noursei TaxID=1971 RepID=UPI003804D3CB